MNADGDEGGRRVLNLNFEVFKIGWGREPLWPRTQ
ncbi:hypothetical protein SLEP1_g38077 [Rubroshorea leprosula]|uniref:Uncharacterized protein n=1 Tax=Rubroshorea leprosula TaxID=152421 RepID=A0AAV5KX19_9ROSI|nr:hypothetical protein SLEP1_g38077 [Rubroshorea leprosula]